MSNVDSEQQPETLDEALKEIDSLRSQLSDSDLKVFSQNRELRLENKKLKEEIQQLTEQCVTQTFKVRGLEKNESKLTEALSSSQAQTASLEAKVSELESQVTELGGELEEFRSKEIHLSQELEKTIATNAEALEKLIEEQSQEAERRKAEYEKALKEWESSVAEREQAIKALEERVELFKEEFLSQEFEVSSYHPSESSGSAATAFELLSSRMEDFLGYPGRAMVEQVFRLSGVEQSSTNAAELEETFEVLQDSASQLVRSPEQEQDLASLLKTIWQELGLGDDSSAPSASVVAEPSKVPEEPPTQAETQAPLSEQDSSAEAADESGEEVREESQASTELPAPEASSDPEDSAEAAEDVDSSEVGSSEFESEPELQESAQEKAENDESSAQEVSPESDSQDTDESLEGAISESQSPEEAGIEQESATQAVSETGEAATEPEAEASSEESSAATVEAEAIPEQEEEPLAEPESTSTPEESSSEESDSTDGQEDANEAPQPEVSESQEESAVDKESPDFETAAALLEEGRFEEALPLFEALYSENPSETTHQVGRVACLVGLEKFAEAYALGKEIVKLDLGEAGELLQENLEAALVGLANSAESDLIKKEYLLELLLGTELDEDAQPYLDAADEIAMRIKREGELSLLQATYRIAQDDVTEYLIDALHSLSDRPETFSLLKTNLERYPELRTLSEFLARLLDSPRAESLEAEVAVKDLLGQGETIEELIDEADPGEEAMVQVFLEHLIPRSEVAFDVPSEEFEELMLDAEPAAFVGSLRQALRSVDYTVFFEEIEVLSYDGEELFLLRSSPEPKPTLLFGSELDDVPPEELRFLVLRELFSMYRRHSQLAHISAGLDDQKRVELVGACVDIYSEFESKIPQETLDQLEELESSATENGQDEAFRLRLESFLREVYLQTESDSFMELGDFLYGGQLNRKWLDPIADSFAAKQTGLVVASYAICRDQLEEEAFEQLEENGFGWLYASENLPKYTDLRLRLQRLWSTPLKALISEPEE